ncbi:PucR family transcriptional regulator [Nocardioides sp. B-3]|uniref:PucR family transcriptional regulator n=1 Tax=Nocardioides sp. B-3 TaxID=2895565 RepID=UPI0021524276|nr:helix-turn-helix domain-containing protein [Nocardioides sp. B-3]UUZ61546.1 helix-turn-helix domain-containing protein [Nocardioides sp. B-3]
MTEQLVRTIVSEHPGYEGTTVPIEDLRRSCHDNIVSALELLAIAVGDDKPPPPESVLYDAARETGHRRADRGLPLDELLRSYRMGGRLIWEDLLGEALADDRLDADALRIIGTRLWQVIDETSAQVARAYHATELRIVRADEQRRASLWEGLLFGRGGEPAFALEASRILDLRIDGPLAIAAVDHPDPGGAVVDDSAERLRAGGITSTRQRRADCHVGFIQLANPDLGPTLDVLRATAGIAVGVSSVVRGIGRIDVAFREALTTLRTIEPDVPAVVSYDERLPDALLLGSPRVAQRLVSVWLGAVLALPVGEHTALLETPETRVACGGSATRTAERLPCHRNTVLNRVRRVAELTGLPPGEDPPPMELALALRAWRLTHT